MAVAMAPDGDPAGGLPAAFHDAGYPAYSMATAAGMLGVAPDFLRGLGQAGLLAPARSGGGHRRYSQDDLLLAARARQIVDDGHTLAAACRIVALEREITRLQAELASATAAVDRLTAAPPVPRRRPRPPVG